jgi:hypothetical protein
VVELAQSGSQKNPARSQQCDGNTGKQSSSGFPSFLAEIDMKRHAAGTYAEIEESVADRERFASG